MILRSLALENFGLYGGRTVFDLTPGTGPDGARPVVLIGGRNGAGKTTFLEAVRLALYGQRALGARVGRADYETYLAGRVHRRSGGGGQSTASVELEFDYAEAGVVHRYAVRREWRAGEGARARETLRLEKDGRLVDAVPRDEWHAFLQELVPPGVSQLFFFDGEKIQEMADADDDTASLVEAVRGLLGIETVGRLRTDIGFYLARHRRGLAATGEDGPDLEGTERGISATRDEIETAVGEAAELESLKEARARVLERARRRFVQEGGELAVRRGEIEARREALRHAIVRAETELRGLANGLLPLAVAPSLLARFEAAVERRLRRSSMEASSSRHGLLASIAAWRGSPQPARRARWSNEHWRDLERFAGGLAPEAGSVEEESDASALSGIGDLAGLRDQLLQARVVAAPRAAALGGELETLEEELRQVEALLGRVDGFDESSAMLVEEVAFAERQLAETGAGLAAAEERLRALRYRAAAAEKHRTRLLETSEAAAALDRRTSLAGRVGETLAVYETRLMARKVARLEEEFVRAFRAVARKDDLLERVVVDPETFRVRLIDKDGREVPKTSLSAGERQIFAVALLWALARISGRPLPMIIDTPLARLDGEHRRRLVERYFPAASHQVILLSTDEEVRGTLLRELSPGISHAYRIDYDPGLGRSVVSAGYFEDAVGLREDSRAVQQA